MRLLITGAAGMLGQRVSEVAEQSGHEVVGIDRQDVDITDARAISTIVRDERPDAVVNCAAYTDVDGAESDAPLAQRVNGAGAGNVAAAAAAHGARIVHVSTDYVFDGARQEPWLESDPVGPLSIYGRSKLIGERTVAAGNPDHAIVRSAWLFGRGGRNFPDTMLRLAAERDSVAVVTDQVGCPTWTGHLAPALLQLAQLPTRGIFHVAGAGSCSWFELAKEVFAQAGVEIDVQPTTTAELGLPAARPAWSVLGTEREETPRLPDWREGVAGHLSETMAR